MKEKVYYEKESAGSEIIELCKAKDSKDPEHIGEYRGLKMFLEIDTVSNTYEIKLKANGTYKVSLGTDKYGNITRIDNVMESLLKKLEDAENLVDEIEEKYGEKRNVGIQKVYSINNEEYQPVSIKTARTNITEGIEEEIEKREEEQRRKEQTVNGIYLASKPISGTITSRFGNRESIRTHAHTGLDIAAPKGTTIKAAASGTVIWSGYQGSYGNLVKIDHGNGVVTYYGHCSKLYVSVGEKVEAGDSIAAVGSTGNSTGNHLHFEIQINGTSVNPQNYLYK